MSDEKLQAASDALRQAAVDVDDAALEERIYDHSRQLANLAAGERQPDQGRIGRHVDALREIRDDVDGEVLGHVDQAIDFLQSFRESLEGV